MKLAPYAKAVAALLGSVATWGTTSLSDGTVSAGDWFGLCAALATALTVFAVSNRPQDGK